MTKKIFRISSMTLGLALLLLGNGMNQAKADLKLVWPSTNMYENKYFILQVKIKNGLMPVFMGNTVQGGISKTTVSSNSITNEKWMDNEDGAVILYISDEAKKMSNHYTVISKPMGDMKYNGAGTIQEVLNKMTFKVVTPSEGQGLTKMEASLSN